MYRPTVRYADAFRDFVDGLFHATHLDRNQIIRGALFAAAHSNEFRQLLEPFRKKDVPLPSPEWCLGDGQYWMDQSAAGKERRKDVNVEPGGKRKDYEIASCAVGGGPGKSSPGRFEQVARPGREIPSEPIAVKNQGGISFTIN